MRLWPFAKQQKIMAPAPGAERKSVSMFLPQLAAKFFGNSNASYESLAEEGYAVNWAAYACINRIAAAMTSVEWQLYKKSRGGKLEEVNDHPLLDLLDKPNPAQSRNVFFKWMYTTFLISGNAYVLGNGMDKNPGRPPLELQLLNPGRMRIEPGRVGYFPAFYEYRPTPAVTNRFNVDPIRGASPILHVKTVNPLSELYGLSPLVASAYSIDTINSGKKWNKKLLDNEARPSGALVVKDATGNPGELGDEQYARITQMVDQMFSGANNAGRPLILEGGLEWKELSMSPKDLDFIKGAYASASDVAVAMGVPPQLLGIPGASTFANMEQAKVAFWTDTVIPWLCLMLEEFNRWLVPLYGEGLYLWYDEEMIPALEPLRKEKADRINAAGYMTINEKREAMGLDTLDEGGGGDIVLVQSSLVPLDLAGESLLAEPGSPADPEIEKPKPADEDPKPKPEEEDADEE